MFPVAAAVADDQKGVVMKRLDDHVFVEVVPRVAVEGGPNVLVNRFEFNEHQRQAVDEADQLCAAIAIGGTQAHDLQFSHGQAPVQDLDSTHNILCGRDR